MNMIKSLLIACLISFLCVNPSTKVFAEPQPYSAEGEYRMGDRDTREEARKFAVTDAKRKIAEQAGVLVESSTEVENLKLIQDKIRLYAMGIMNVKNERTEFIENGIVCKAYVTATVDTDAMKNEVLKLIKKWKEEDTRQTDRKTEKREHETRDPEKPSKIDNSPKQHDKKEKENKNIIDTDKYDVSANFSSVLSELEEVRAKMVRDLSKATAYTAGSEYKLQEVTGIRDVGSHSEKGEISNYLKENFEMPKNYRFAELTPFVEAAGADKIIRILEEVNKKKILDAKDRMTWAKIERARAKSYGEIVIKEATDLFNRAEILMVDANEKDKARLRTIRIEADDAIKLIHALEVRNKAVDEVAKKYEKANKITAKNDKYNPKKKKNFIEDIWDRIK
ncbi:MAG: hypothetical protein IKZ53_11155 [Selenomonadaceae bacterium]|nr:hypothetical protein [Selenomonadaceae bacterium]